MRQRSLVTASRALALQADALRFSPPVHYVYNPLMYAREPQEGYLALYARGSKSVVFLGMNPGPWGMAQTGVPFGEIGMVRDWLSVTGHVRSPASVHPRVPVTGFACPRSEVSGRRLWGLMRDRYGTAEAFSRDTFVGNYCPLLFLDEAGRNLTPDKLAKKDRDALFPLCDLFLSHLLATLRPRWAVGVGLFAYHRIQAVLGSAARASGEAAPRAVMMPHPSPANPQANRDWAGRVSELLVREGVWQAMDRRWCPG